MRRLLACLPLLAVLLAPLGAGAAPSAIYAFGDSKDALISVLSGIAFSEAQIWTQPWRANSDLTDYRNAFPTTIASRQIQWELRPTLRGVELAFKW